MSRLTKIYSQPNNTCALSYNSISAMVQGSPRLLRNAFEHTPCKVCDTCLFFLTGKAIKETLCPD